MGFLDILINVFGNILDFVYYKNEETKSAKPYQEQGCKNNSKTYNKRPDFYENCNHILNVNPYSFLNLG